jgi:hypothetical protein
VAKHEKVSGVHSKTQDNLMRAAKKLDHSIEQRIDKIKIRKDKDSFISFVLSDTFPDKFKEGEILGFADVSGYGDKLPDGQYGVKIFFDEKNLKKPSEFTNVTTGEQYLFITDTKKTENSDNISTSEFSITTEECIWITVVAGILPDGSYIIRYVCLNCPDCYDE